VLDRANVIEFRVTSEELEEFLKNPAKPDLDLIKGKGAGMAADFVKLTKTKADNFEGSEFLNSTLIEFFNELKKTGAEFGYRNVSEIHCFCAKLNSLTKDEKITFEIDDLIDAAILQKLLPKLGGGRVAAREVMIRNDAVSNLIREHKIAQIKNVIETNYQKGMVSFSRAIKDLYSQDLITEEVAQTQIEDPSMLV
jgi:5-methylcytosine-specific restriction protein B